MAELAWVTDIHLNFLDVSELSAFFADVAATGADAVLIGGDIAEAPSLCRLLSLMADAVARPIYFVLGNHDYYYGDVASVRDEVRALCDGHRWLRWLPAVGAVRISDTTTLCGHGGWGDGRLGDYLGSTVMLNDYRLIGELTGVTALERRRRLEALGDEAAAHAERVVAEAVARAERVVFLTHVPPFRDACWHEGQISDDNWLPHFSCKAVGDALVRVMDAHPDRQLTVLCGHTHGEGVAHIRPNLEVRTGAAVYGAPAVQPLIRC